MYTFTYELENKHLKNEKLTTRCLCVQQMAVLARLALIADELGETDLANTYRSHILYHIKNSRPKLRNTLYRNSNLCIPRKGIARP